MSQGLSCWVVFRLAHVQAAHASMVDKRTGPMIILEAQEHELAGEFQADLQGWASAVVLRAGHGAMLFRTHPGHHPEAEAW